jgi:ribosome-associated heat shock protein Hsp15
MAGKPTAPVQRLDRWLWFARLLKSRTLAAQLVERGKVRVNRVRVVKTSHALRQGDVLTLALRGKVRVLKVLALGARRGPPKEARGLYQDLNEEDGPSEAHLVAAGRSCGTLLQTPDQGLNRGTAERK